MLDVSSIGRTEITPFFEVESHLFEVKYINAVSVGSMWRENKRKKGTLNYLWMSRRSGVSKTLSFVRNGASLPSTSLICTICPARTVNRNQDNDSGRK